MARRLGFTLLELLMVIAIIAILAGLLLPSFTRAKARGQRITCLSNLREIGIGFQMFANDHNHQYPPLVPQRDGGTYEVAATSDALAHFLSISNEIVTPKVLACPSDSRIAAQNWKSINKTNVSYAVFLDASPNVSATPLCADRNISMGGTGSDVLAVDNPALAYWTSELHSHAGNILFGDAHVEQADDKHLRLAMSAGFSNK
ncbi:MAG: prepilin-type N-terminal cleavage/methylation domain [Verrucomicrobiales bacterium]|nr:prepilin-type N-terminal cleavage/methylation domain [Verrucomicrobiales bacterium]MDB6130988.1 prepilin-type N-terminal cleavage/methylation domain [Verrucomicrobiales bacterium]